MSTTPRTDAFEIKAAHDAIEYGKTWQPMVFARELEAELACEKENRNHLIEKGAKLETELAAAKECVAIANRSADDQMHQKREAQTELARLRALFPAICSALGNGACCTPDVSIGFLESIPNKVASVVARLRADLERFTGHGLLDCHAICDQRDAAVAERDQLRAELATCKDASESLVYGQRAENDRLIDENVKLNGYADMHMKEKARAERAEAALAEWSVLNLWGGTPEIIHEFIKGQQNRIHHCQDLEAECLEQARLLGMSGEREADLLGKLERAKADTARLDWLLDRSAQTYHSYSNHLGGGNYVQYHKDRAAIDAAMKP